jgi:plastocyanin
MRRLLTVVAVIAGLAAAPVAEAATRTVNIQKGGFVPTSVTITAQDTVTWVNRDTVNHQVVSDRGNFVSPILRPGQRYSFQFVDAGTFRYRDALEPAERGTVIVRGLPPAVSFGATVPILVYGAETHLQGVVNSKKAGETVAIFAQPLGQASFQQVAVLQTGAGGAFDWVTKPQILTNYQVQFKTATSQPVTVQVQPKLSLMPARRGWLLARVTAGRSFAGRWIYLQRRNAFGQWVSLRKLVLGSKSGKLFRRPTTPGVYRVFMTVNQAGSGYLASQSGTQTIVRR